jgi:tetratricopeptide (TPR) repeat protein
MNRAVMIGVLALVGMTGLLAQPKGPAPKSKGEAEAVMELQKAIQANDPDALIKAADGLITKYADTEFKGIALQLATMAYQQKRDYPKMVIYAERTLEADPKNYSVMLILAQGLAQNTRENDLDKDEKLNNAEKYANTAMNLLKTAEKPNPSLTDEQWEAGKKDIIAQAHEALGLIAMVRKKYDVAVSEFKTAVDTASQPDAATMVRLGAAYNGAKMHDAAIAILDKVMAMPDAHPQIKQFAQAERVRAFQAKGGVPKPAAPAVTPASAPAPGAPAAPAPAPAPAPAKP